MFSANMVPFRCACYNAGPKVERGSQESRD